MEFKSIILYDVATSVPDRSFSPNVAKIRYALNYKHFSFKTIFVELSDLPALYGKLGAAPLTDGGPAYTVPLLHDPSTTQAISNSLDIALYLDAAYPTTPRLIAKGTEALHAVFTALHADKVAAPMSAFTFRATFPYLNAPTQELFERPGRSPMGVVTSEEKKTENWEALKRRLDEFDGFIGQGREYFSGDGLSYADFVLAGHIRWAKYALSEDQWDEIAHWNGGRWGKLVAGLEIYDSLSA
ncbi:Glutathione transferase fungal specific class A [Mycena kentingensis (nom. inval.)]|nr:Glutathione transferase fungal specific class A [Mycena kentingensis (nom. inval.)]